MQKANNNQGIHKEKDGGFTLSDIKSYYYKAVVIRTMWYWQKKRKINQ